jgi:hypothetical protein
LILLKSDKLWRPSIPFARRSGASPGFRHQLKPHSGQSGHELEGQQQVLRVYFGGIYTCVRQLLPARIKKLNYWYKKTNDSAVKAEIDRLAAELEKLPERWDFHVR